MLQLFSSLEGEIDDERKDMLWFIVRVTERIERYDECYQMVMALVAVDSDVNAHRRSMSIAVIKVLLEQNFGALKKFRNALMEKKLQSNAIKARVNEMIANTEREQVMVHERFVNLLGETFMKSAADPKDQYQLHKEIGDSFVYVADVLKGEAKTKMAKRCHESYDAAIKLADQCYGKSSFEYLASMLNYCVLEYKHMNMRDHPKSLLSSVFFHAMKNTKDMAPNALAVLQLIRSNVASWSHAAEEEPQDKKQRRARKRK